MKKNLLGKAMTSLIISLAIIIPAIASSAQSGTGTVTTGHNQVMMQAETNKYRSCSFSHVNIKADAVFPAPGYYVTDNLTYCWTRIYLANSNAVPMSDPTSITEGQGYYWVTVYNSYANTAHYYDICFASPNSNPATIVYGYDGL